MTKEFAPPLRARVIGYFLLDEVKCAVTTIGVLAMATAESTPHLKQEELSQMDRDKDSAAPRLSISSIARTRTV